MNASYRRTRCATVVLCPCPNKQHVKRKHQLKEQHVSWAVVRLYHEILAPAAATLFNSKVQKECRNSVRPSPNATITNVRREMFGQYTKCTTHSQISGTTSSPQENMDLAGGIIKLYFEHKCDRWQVLENVTSHCKQLSVDVRCLPGTMFVMFEGVLYLAIYHYSWP